MSFRPTLFLCLCLVSGPLAAEPFRSGAIRLRLSAPPVAQPIQPGEDPVARLCALLKNGGGADCRLTSVNGFPRGSGGGGGGTQSQPLPFLQLSLLSSDVAGNGTFRAALFARLLAWSDSQPMETPCGRFTWSLRLDPRATQPVSEVTLRPEAHGASQGTVSGTLQIAAQIRFESVDTHRHLIVPATLLLPLYGSWSVSEGGIGTDDPDVSNLQLFAGRPSCARPLPLAGPLTGKICLSSVSEGARK